MPIKWSNYIYKMMFGLKLYKRSDSWEIHFPREYAKTTIWVLYKSKHRYSITQSVRISPENVPVPNQLKFPVQKKRKEKEPSFEDLKIYTHFRAWAQHLISVKRTSQYHNAVNNKTLQNYALDQLTTCVIEGGSKSNILCQLTKE